MLQFPSSWRRAAESNRPSLARAALLPELRRGSQRPADLRRLLVGDLPALRHAAGIFRRTGNRMMDPTPGLACRVAAPSGSHRRHKTHAGARAQPAGFGVAAGERHYRVVDFSYGERYCRAAAAAGAVSAGVGAGGADLVVRVLRVCRTGIDVPRLRRAIHLSARGLWRPDRISLRLDAIQRGQRRNDRRAIRGVGSIPGTGVSRSVAGARGVRVRWGS